MKSIIVFILMVVSLYGCSQTKSEDFVSKKNIDGDFFIVQNENYFEQLIKEGNSVFYISDLSSQFLYDATICKDFILEQNIYIEDACIDPIVFKDDLFRHGVLEFKKPLSQVSYMDNENFVFKYNIYSVILADGRRYKSINKNNLLPFQKKSTIETKYSLNLALNNMIKNNLIEDYKFTNFGIIAKSDNGDVLFNDNALLSLNFLGEYIDISDYNKAIQLLPSVNITFVDKEDPGYLIPILNPNKKELNSISLDYTTTNLRGQESVKTTLLIFRGIDVNINKTPEKIAFLDSDYEIIINNANFKKTNSSYIFTFDESENDIVKKIIKPTMNMKFYFKEEESVFIVNNESDNIDKMFDGMKLIQLMNL